MAQILIIGADKGSTFTLIVNLKDKVDWVIVISA